MSFEVAALKNSLLLKLCWISAHKFLILLANIWLRIWCTQRKVHEYIQSEAVDSILNFVSLSRIVGLQAEVRFILDDAMQTVRFKNELERNITIKLGYANAKIYKCEDEHCPRPMAYKYGCEHNSRDRLMYQEACTIDCKQHNSFVISSSLLYIWREC